MERFSTKMKSELRVAAMFAAVATMLTQGAPAYSQIVRLPEQEARVGMGESKFDANQVEKYTVNVTNGNLFIAQTDFVVPSRRGASMVVERTYNSRNFDAPRLFGRGNWSFSLNKFLDTREYHRCTDEGDLEDVEEGDLLEEEPQYEEPECCADTDWPPDCCDDSWPPDCCDETWPPECCEDTEWPRACCEDTEWPRECCGISPWPPDCCDETDWPPDCCAEEPWPPECCDSDPWGAGWCDRDELDDLCGCCEDLSACYDDCDTLCGEQSNWDECLDICYADWCDGSGDYDACLSDGFCDVGGSPPSECREKCDGVLYDDTWDCDTCDWPCACSDDPDKCGACDWPCACGEDQSECDACGWPCACGEEQDECDACDWPCACGEDEDECTQCGWPCACGEDQIECDACGWPCACGEEDESDCAQCNWSCACGEEDEEGNNLCSDVCNWPCACGDYELDDPDSTPVCDACNWSCACGGSGDEGNDPCDYCSFDIGQYEDVQGFLFNDGDGDAIMIFNDTMAAAQNPYHIEVREDPDYNRVRLKDGSVYTFQKPSPVDYSGRIVAMADRYGNTVSYAYDTSGKLTIVTDAVGRQIAIGYNGDGFIESVTAFPGTPDERAMRFAYDPDGYLVRVVNFDTKETTYDYYTYEAWGGGTQKSRLLKSVTDANGHSLHFEYVREDSPFLALPPRAGEYKCSRVYKESGTGDTRYSYEPRGDSDAGRTTVTDSRGYPTVKRWQKLGIEKQYEQKLVTQIYDALGDETFYEYDRMLNLVKTADTNDLIHAMTYDAMGNMLTKTEDPQGVNLATNRTYEPAFNQVFSATDANGYTTYYFHVQDGNPSEYGPDGVLWKEVDMEGNATHHWYNEFGQRIKTIDANGNLTEYRYEDSWGNLTRTVRYSSSEYAADGRFEATSVYDQWGNRIAETDFNGNLTQYQYDVRNRLTDKIVRDGGEQFQTSYTYDNVGNKRTVTDPRGNTTEYVYDSADRLIEAREPEGRTIAYSYDGENNKTLERDPDSNTTYFIYDPLNRLTQRIEPQNKITLYCYSGAGDSSTDGGEREYTRRKDRSTTTTSNNGDGRGNVSTTVMEYTYDTLYRIERVQDAMGGFTHYEYDSVGNKTAEADAEGRRTEYRYYPRGLLYKAIDPYGHETVYTYDGMGNKVSERDKNGHYTYCEYTRDRNLLTGVTDHMGLSIAYVYDGMNKRKEKDRNGNLTEFRYNARNLLVETLLPNDASHVLGYDSNGNRTLEIDPNGNKTLYAYDGLNRMKEKTEAYAALNLTTRYFYDPVGNRIRIQDAEGRSTHYQYDSLNRLVEVRDALGGETTYRYDTSGNKVWTIDAEGNRTDYYYDRLNRLNKAINPLGKTAHYGYDRVGNRVDQWDAKGDHIRYNYDTLNRLIQRTCEETGISIEYGYDAAGNRIRMIDTRPGIDDVEYRYDTLNRLITVLYSGGRSMRYEYDSNGNRILMIDPEGGQTRYHYDEMNRVDHLVDPDGGITGYIYDAGSRLSDMHYPNGAQTHYAYDTANRVTSMVTRNSDGAVLQSITYDEYDAVGNRISVTDDTGTTTYIYDALCRLTDVAYAAGGTESYSYDKVGNRLEKWINAARAEQYGYNPANQLVTRQVSGSGTPTKGITVTGTVSDQGPEGFSGVEEVRVNGVQAAVNGNSFTASGVVLHPGENIVVATVRDKAWNATSQIVTVTYTPDATVSYSYSYDDNGNQIQITKKVSGSPDEVTTYEYDFENRLTRVTDHASRTTGFEYDGDKRRVSRTSNSGQVTRFLYDGINILKDYDASGAEQARYVQGIGIDTLISRRDNNGPRYFHSDALGSTRIITDFSQNIAARDTYDAWGKITEQTGETAHTYGFTAREWEEDIGLQYNRARFYDPEIGRFITQDPLSKGPDDPTIAYFNGAYSIFHRFIKVYADALQPDKTNRYVYCYNNPVNLIDPLGLSPEDDQMRRIGEISKAEQRGDTRTENTGKSRFTGTEQKGEISEDVKNRKGIEKAVVRPEIKKRDTHLDHRECLDIRENGEMVFTISENGLGYAINLGRNPGVSIGKHETHVASGGIHGLEMPAGVKGAVVGTMEGIGTGTADTALEKGARGSLHAFGRAGGIGIAVEAGHRAYNISSIVRDSDTHLSSAEKASLASLEVSSGATSVLGGIAGAKVGAAIGTLVEGGIPGPGTIIGGVVGGAVGGSFTASGADWIIKEQTQIYRWND